MEKLDWTDIAHFLAVCRTGSLLAAARQLGVAHTTVGRRVAALEKALGSRLFERARDGYSPTARGIEIRALAEDMSANADALVRRVAGRDLALSGIVRLTTTGSLAAHFVVPSLGRLLARHPGLSVEVVADNSIRNLARREADIAMRLVRPKGGALIGRKIGQVGYGLYASRDFCKRYKVASGGFDPARMPFIGFDEDSSHLQLTHWLRNAAGGASPCVASNSIEAQTAAVAAGLGAGLLPAFVADRNRDFVRLLRAEAGVTFDLWLVYHRDMRNLPRLRAVADHLIEAAHRSRKALAG